MRIFNRFQKKREDETERSDRDFTGKNPPDEAKSGTGILDKFRLGLSKTGKNLNEKINALVKRTKKLDDDFFEELEEILIQADVGVTTTLDLVNRIRRNAKTKNINEADQVVASLKQEVKQVLACHEPGLTIVEGKVNIILVVGVNGVGKTTSIAKMAYRFKKQNLKVLLVAADTFRAAAIDQLQIWADKVGVDLVKHQEGSDPGAVVYDALNAIGARKTRVLIIDTAGRLQNKINLMKEISKVKRIIERDMPESHLETLLVLDATTGQNAISQAKVFQEATGVNGIILTKLDGTAKGGIVLAIAKELNLPVKLVGIGEKLDDLRDFSPEIFAQALFDE